MRAAFPGCTRRTVAAGVSALVVSVVAWWALARPVVAADGDGDRRDQQAAFTTYVDDPLFHDYVVLDATASTLAAGDQMVEISVTDGSGSCVMRSTNVGLIPVAAGAIKARTNRVRFRADPWPSGEVFTVTAKYYDGAWNPLDTEQVTLVKP